MKYRSFFGAFRASFSRAFTLVEVLATCAVLALMVLILVQITSATARTTILSNQIMDAAAQSRLAFDRIGLDLAAVVKRPDVDFYVRDPNSATANAGYSKDDDNTLLLFLAAINSADPTLTTSALNRSISFIAYQVNTHTDNKGRGGEALPCLIRAGKAVPWGRPGSWESGTGYMGLNTNELPVRFNSSDPNFVASLLPLAPAGSAANDYDIIAQGVIRMVVGFQLYPDNLPVTLADGTSLIAQGQVVYSAPVRIVTGRDGTTTAKYIDLNRIGAIGVGLVILDRNSLQLLSAAHIAAIVSNFPVPSNNKLPLQAWSSVADGLTSALAGSVPLPALKAVRVYQRFYPITPFPANQP